MAAPAAATEQPREHGRLLERARVGSAAMAGAILGAAPHVLHHAGPLAGAALLATASGKLLFGAVGFVLAIPMLRRIRRRSSSWRLPGALLVSMVAAFTVSTLVIGPALAGSESQREPAKARPNGVSPAEHESHHR